MLVTQRSRTMYVCMCVLHTHTCAYNLCTRYNLITIISILYITSILHVIHSIYIFFLSLHLFLFLKFIYLFCFLWPHLWHMDIPRLEVESELQLPACTTATAMPDPSCVCDLCHSSQQCRILNPLSEARDQTHILMDASQVPNLLSHSGNS